MATAKDKAMRIRHKFSTVLQNDGGKQHWFTWTVGGKESGTPFQNLFYGMYQSGSDEIDSTGTKRGEVLRILPKEATQDMVTTTAYTSSSDTENGVLRVRVDAEGWTADDYLKVAKTALTLKNAEGAEFTHTQKTALLAQIASVYNLMATQYGKEFDIPINEISSTAIENAITDQKLKALSDWFKNLAEQHQKNALSTDKLPDLSLPSPVQVDATPALIFNHGIIVPEGGGRKKHSFYFKNADGKKLLDAEYESGNLGESILLKFDLETGGTVAIPFNLFEINSDVLQFMQETSKEGADQNDLLSEIELQIDALQNENGIDLSPPASFKQQVQKLQHFAYKYNLTAEQQTAALLMLGSVTKLMATHYQRQYPIDKEVNTPQELKQYVRDTTLTSIAKYLQNAAINCHKGEAITELSREQKKQLGGKRRGYGIDTALADKKILDLTQSPFDSVLKNAPNAKEYFITRLSDQPFNNIILNPADIAKPLFL